MEKKWYQKVDTIALGVLSVVWLLVQLYFSLLESLHPMVMCPLFLAFGIAIVFVVKPFPFSDKVKFLRIFDLAAILVLAWIVYYYFVNANRMITRIPHVSPVYTVDAVVMILLVVLLLEAVRRTLGWSLLGFVLVFIAYCFFGNYFPGFMKFEGFDLAGVTEIFTLTTNGLFGTPLSTSASYIFWFIVFGAFFAACGGGQLLIDIGMRFSNPKTGGPAKAAVVSSGLMGMVSGSAVANVTTTGVLTIPMMKKAGYKPEHAAAIESVASTGGQIMPPIMGVGAFIMAELLGIGYGEIAMNALIPAIAYYASVFLLVHFIGKKNTFEHRSDNVTREDLTFDTKPILPRLYLLIPAIILVVMVMTGQSLRRSAMIATVAVLLLNLIPTNRVNLKGLYDALIDAMVQSANIALPTAACGIIIAAVVQSGLANKFSGVIATVGGSYLIVALIITMLGCLILGMAVPAVAAYLIAVTLFVPVLTSLGLSLMVAHMFCFYFGVMAQITPPVCLASFTAAGIAKADSWKTGWTAFFFAFVAFLVPYVFVYQPAILLQGTPVEIIIGAVTMFIGVYALAGAVGGFMFAPLNWLYRGLLFVAALLLIFPGNINAIIAIVVLAIVVVINRRARAKLKAEGATIV